MSRRDLDRLDDITSAITAIRDHLTHGSLHQSLIFDAVRVRLIEIGEAVKALSPELVAEYPTIDWRAIARSRDQLTHHYWDTAHTIVEHIVARELDDLAVAADRLHAVARARDFESPSSGR